MCGRTCLKIIIGIINAIFLLAGGLMLAFGVVALVNPGLIVKLLTQNADFLDNIGDIDGFEGLLKGIGIFMIILGGVVFVFAFFGLFGACCENSCMLITFVILLFVILLAEIALILVAAFAEDLVKTEVQNGVYDFIENRFEGGLEIRNNSAVFPNTVPASSTWEAFQIFFRCCGIYNSSDFQQAKEWDPKAVYINDGDKPAIVPLSCCKIKGDAEFVTPDILVMSNFEDNFETNCLASGASVNEKNCYEKTKTLIEDYSKIAIGIAAGICGVEIIMIILAIIMIVLVRKNNVV